MKHIRSLTLIGMLGCLTGCMSTTAAPTSLPSTVVLATPIVLPTATVASLVTPTVGEVPQRLAFVANQINRGTIMISGLDAKPPQILNPDFPLALDPTWSPDGNELAFVVQDSDGFNIYISSADGSNLFQVTNAPGDDQSPSWSPDGQQLVFQSNRSGNDELYLINRDGSKLVQVTNDPARDWQPSWSPDGSLIAFTSDRGAQTPDGWNDQLYVIQPDGQGLKYLTEGFGRARHPAWSPDSQQLVYVVGGGDVGSNSIYTVKRDGIDPTLLRPNAFDPQWLDQRILFTTYDEQTFHTALRILDLNTLEVTVPITMADTDLIQPVLNR